MCENGRFQSISFANMDVIKRLIVKYDTRSISVFFVDRFW